MRLLVTGATGFVGRHVVERLLANGHAVLAVARNLNRARTLTWFDRVEFLALDIHARTDEVVSAAHGVEGIVHLAWDGLPNYKSLTHLERTLPGEIAFVGRLAAAGVPRLLVTGTCLEYGLRQGALAEDMLPDPVTPYAEAKDVLRRYVFHLERQYPCQMRWARLFYMYGAGQNSSSLIPQLDAAIDRGDASFDMSGGEQLRDYLAVTEIASKLTRLIEHPSFSGVVNVCRGEPISVRRLAEAHLASRGSKIALNLGRFPYNDYEPLAFWGDARKFHAVEHNR